MDTFSLRIKYLETDDKKRDTRLYIEKTNKMKYIYVCVKSLPSQVVVRACFGRQAAPATLEKTMPLFGCFMNPCLANAIWLIFCCVLTDIDYTVLQRIKWTRLINTY